MQSQAHPSKSLGVEVSIQEIVIHVAWTVLLDVTLSPRCVHLGRTNDERYFPVLEAVERLTRVPVLVDRICRPVKYVFHVCVHVQDELAVRVVVIVVRLIVDQDNHVEFHIIWVLRSGLIQQDALVGGIVRINLDARVYDCLRLMVEEEQHVDGKKNEHWVHHNGAECTQEGLMAILATLLNV